MIWNPATCSHSCLRPLDQCCPLTSLKQHRCAQKALLVSWLSSLTDIHQRSIIAWIWSDWLPLKQGSRSRRDCRRVKSRRKAAKVPFLSLSLSSRSQGHTWDEGMEMKEWSLKDVISRLGEGEWAGKATDPSWPPFRNLTKKPNYSHIWTMDIKEIHRIPAYTLPVDVKMRYVISHSKRTETLVSLQETAVFLNHLNSSTGIKMSFLFTLSCLLQVHQHLQSSANQTWHPTLGIALYSVQPRSEPTPTIQPSCVWQICCRETLSSFSLGSKSKPEGCFNLRLQCCYRAGRSTEKRIISSMRDGILHH